MSPHQRPGITTATWFIFSDTPRYASDNTRLRTELGWEPGFKDVRSGLADTIAWYGANEAWWRPQKVTIEAEYDVQGP